MIAVIWPLVILFTVVLYGLILITLPFSATWATIFLFTLIGFWSRLPGVGIPFPLWILYMADLIDFLSMIVAINLGGVYGAIMSLFANIGGRLCGMFTPWGANLSDALAVFVSCLIIPPIHILLGGDIFLTMMVFTSIRMILLIPFDFMGFYPLPLPQYIMEWLGAGFGLYIFNGFYARLTGDFFDNLLQSGVAFSWHLFIFATVVIVTAYLIMSGLSKKVAVSQVKKVKSKIIEEWYEARDAKRERKEGKKTKTGSKTVIAEENAEEKSHKKTLSNSVKTIKEGCPFCHSDVKGNARAGFYCDECNLIYTRRELKITPIKEDEDSHS